MGETTRVRNTKLLSQMIRNAAWDSSRLIQERAEETYRAELGGKPEPHVIPTLGASQFAVGVVEVEMPCESVCARFAGIPAISPFLLGRQERNWHLFSS
jgi:hypothetical protein